MSRCTPRFSMHRVITLPRWVCGTRMLARQIGSRISSIDDRSGSFDGLSTYTVSPFFSTTSNTTVGAVVIRSRSYSRSRRSWMISMCSMPRKPIRKPKPSASELSGSYCSAASLRVSFSRASRKFSKSSELTGNRPA
ncbi:hypothetical protein D9M71_694190 [compost metagenome]